MIPAVPGHGKSNESFLIQKNISTRNIPPTKFFSLMMHDPINACIINQEVYIRVWKQSREIHRKSRAENCMWMHVLSKGPSVLDITAK